MMLLVLILCKMAGWLVNGWIWKDLEGTCYGLLRAADYFLLCLECLLTWFIVISLPFDLWFMICCKLEPILVCIYQHYSFFKYSDKIVHTYLHTSFMCMQHIPPISLLMYLHWYYLVVCTNYEVARDIIFHHFSCILSFGLKIPSILIGNMQGLYYSNGARDTFDVHINKMSVGLLMPELKYTKYENDIDWSLVSVMKGRT